MNGTEQLVWEEFAQRNGAELKFSPSSALQVDNTYVAELPGEFKVSFVWSYKPLGKERVTRRTEFFFPVPAEKLVPLRVYPKDPATALFFLFSKQRFKMQDALLDKRLLFVSPQPELVRSYSEQLRLLCEFSPWLDFMVESVAGDEPGLLIVVQSLLKDAERIDTFFSVGRAISRRMKR